jgi:glucosylceramidase
LSNAGDGGRNDLDIATAVLADATAKGFVSLVGAQWGVLEKVNAGTSVGGLPVWATEHKCGNYPWCTSSSNGCYAAYDSTQAPNDQAYGVETWDYIRDAITKGKVTAYNAWNMVLDKSGLGIDTTREWKQNALLVADAGKVSPTPAYYVFRHFSRYVVPGATVVGTTGGDAVAFKNPDGSLVAVLFNKADANPNYVVAIGGKKLAFALPGYGWATVRVEP